MKTSAKIKASLAAAGLSYDEFGLLIGLTRQTLHKYLNDPHVYIEDYENGIKAMDMAEQLMRLAAQEKLPLKRGLERNEKLRQIRELLK